MDRKTLENGSWNILGRAAFARENDMPYGDFGYRHIGFYNGIEDAERIIAHLLERGFLEYQRDGMGLHTWAITGDGLKEYERLRNQPTELGATYIERLAETSLADCDLATFGTFPDVEFPDESIDDYLV